MRSVVQITLVSVLLINAVRWENIVMEWSCVSIDFPLFYPCLEKAEVWEKINVNPSEHEDHKNIHDYDEIPYCLLKYDLRSKLNNKNIVDARRWRWKKIKVTKSNTNY